MRTISKGWLPPAFCGARLCIPSNRPASPGSRHTPGSPFWVSTGRRSTHGFEFGIRRQQFYPLSATCLFTIAHLREIGSGPESVARLQPIPRRPLLFWYCILNEAGEVLLEQKLATTPKAMNEGGLRRDATQPDRAENRDVFAMGEPAVERVGARSDRGPCAKRALDRKEPAEE